MADRIKKLITNSCDKKALTYGDPHLLTFDKMGMDFQKPGEYVLVRDAGGISRANSSMSLHIQVRMESLRMLQAARDGEFVAESSAPATPSPHTLQPVGTTNHQSPTPNPALSSPAPGTQPLEPSCLAGVPQISLNTAVAMALGGHNLSIVLPHVIRGTARNDVLQAPAGGGLVMAGGDSGTSSFNSNNQVTFVSQNVDDLNLLSNPDLFGWCKNGADGLPESGQIIWPNIRVMRAGDAFTFAA